MSLLGYLDTHNLKLRTVQAGEARHIADSVMYLRTKLFNYLGEQSNIKLGELLPYLSKADNFEHAIELVVGKKFVVTGQLMDRILVNAAYQVLMAREIECSEIVSARIPEVLNFCRKALAAVSSDRGVVSIVTWREDTSSLDNAYLMLRTINRPSMIFASLVNFNFWRASLDVELHQVEHGHILITDPDRSIELHLFETGAFLDHVKGDIQPITSIPDEIEILGSSDGLNIHLKRIQGCIENNLALHGFEMLSEEVKSIQFTDQSTVPALRKIMAIAPVNLNIIMPHAASI